MLKLLWKRGKMCLRLARLLIYNRIEYDSINFILGEKFSSYKQLKEKISA